MLSEKIRNKDTLAGGVFVLFGVVAFAIALRYEAGTLLDMGPGYFPRMLSGLLVLLGLGIMARGLLARSRSFASWAFKPLFILTLAAILFGFLVEKVGLIPSLAVLIVVSATAGNEYKFKEAIVLAGVMCVFSVAVFVWGLKMNFPLFAWGI